VSGVNAVDGVVAAFETSRLSTQNRGNAALLQLGRGNAHIAAVISQ
jgi:hypothetical protein